MDDIKNTNVKLEEITSENQLEQKNDENEHSKDVDVCIFV